MQETIRGRSWALHDGIADEPFTHVTMYKKIGDPANLETFPHARW
jgi:hypothetical protein